MRNLKRIGLVLILTLVFGSTLTAQDPSVLLEKAIYAEETEGDLNEAIAIYQQIVADTDANRAIAAQALFRLGMCHRKRCALTRDEILKHVWGYDILVTSRSVDRCVNTLRTKIERKPQTPQFIKTIRDVGYRFECPQS